MTDPGRLSLQVVHPNGTETRWSGEEPDTDRLLSDLSFSSTAPGGFRDLSCTLLRGLRIRADEGLYHTVRVTLPGGRVAWEGRIQSLARSTGDQSTLSPQAVGWQAHLEDDPSRRWLFVHQGAENWTAPPVERQAVLYGVPYRITDPSISGGSIVLTHNLTGNHLPISEAWFDAGPGVKVRTISFRYQAAGSAGTDSNWLLGAYASDARTGASALSVSGDLHDTGSATPPSGQSTWTASGGRRYAIIEFLYAATTASNPGIDRTATIDRLAVYGDHGLTRHTTQSGYPDGLYVSDMLPVILDDAAPLLNYSTGTFGSIAPTTFAVPHASFLTPTTAAAAISELNRFHGHSWEVWEDRTFRYQPVGGGTEWHARTSEGAAWTGEGDNASELYNGAFVSYSDADGIQRLAGPTGSGFDVESADLRDADPDNPVNAAAIPRRWLRVDVPFATHDAGAVQLGAIALAEANAARRRGTITLRGTVRHGQTGQPRPVSHVRAGDTVRLVDRPGDPARRLDEVRYSHASRTADCGVNGPLPRSESLFERLAITQRALLS